MNKTNYKNIKRTSGFTLIEIMVALFIFAIIAVITSSVLYTVFNTRRAYNLKSIELSNLQIAITLMQRDITQIIPRPIINNDGGQLDALVLSHNNIEFTRMGHINPFSTIKRSNLQRVAYIFSNGKLIRRTWARLDRAPQTRPSDRILLQNIANLEFSFLGQRSTIYPNWPPGTMVTKYGRRIANPIPRAIQVNIKLKNQREMSLLFTIPSSNLNTGDL